MPGDTVIAEVTSAGVRVRVQSDRDAVKSNVLLPPSPARQGRQAGLDAVLAGTAFAAPKPLESHKVMQPSGAGAHPSDEDPLRGRQMDDQFRMRAPTHYLRVDLRDDAEAEYWLVVLDATRRQLEEAVAVVGTFEPAVRDYLQTPR